MWQASLQPSSCRIPSPWEWMEFNSPLLANEWDRGNSVTSKSRLYKDCGFLSGLLILPLHWGLPLPRCNCPAERPTWQRTERGPQPRACEEWGFSVQQLLRKWMLPANPPSYLSLQMGTQPWQACWRRSCERPWARSTQLNHAQMADTKTLR